MAKKFEVKSYSYQIADTGDYDGHWELSNGKISLLTKDDGDDMQEILDDIAKKLNDSEINFYPDDSHLVDLHIVESHLKEYERAILDLISGEEERIAKAKEYISIMGIKNKPSP